jgi:hypothetical protein
MSQIGLPLDWPEDEDRQDFIVTAANSRAVDHLDRWGSWPVRATLLTGPRKSGRSLLGRIFSARLGGRVIDDAETYNEQMLFHAWNQAQDGAPLLIIADAPPPEWKIRLPDLRSRLAATPIVSIEQPDDLLTRMLLERLLWRRGLAVSQDVLTYLVQRVERSYVMIQRIVDVLDSAALSQKRGITVPFVRETLMAHHILIEPDLFNRS